MSRGSIIVLAYSNGKMIQGEEGVMYDGPDPTMFRISSFATFEVLKQKIHSVLNLEAANQEVSKVTYRFPISANKYRSVQLKSDDDVRCMFGNHAQHSNLSAIELFIDKNTRQARLSQTSAGDRTRPQPTRMATRDGHTAMHVSPVSANDNMFQGADNQVLKYRSFQLRNNDGVLFDGQQQHPCPGAVELRVDVEKVSVHRLLEAQPPVKDGPKSCLQSDERSNARLKRGAIRGGSLGSGRRIRGK